MILLDDELQYYRTSFTCLVELNINLLGLYYGFKPLLLCALI